MNRSKRFLLATLRGLVAGVPIVCMPMGRDQDDTAARVVHHGAGVRISRKASARTIGAPVQRVLADPSYHTSAKRIADAIASRDGCVDIVASLCTTPVAS